MAPQAAARTEELTAIDMEVGVVERRDTPGAWAVEAINYSGDGEVYLTVFTGPDARARAKEYAQFKYGTQ